MNTTAVLIDFLARWIILPGMYLTLLYVAWLIWED